MTTIEPGKKIARETLSSYRRRPLIIELHPTYATLREKGRRAGYTIDYQAIYEAAAKIFAREEKARKDQRERVDR